MDYLISPTKAQSLLGALSGSEEAEVVCEVKCKRARKDKTLYKPVIKIPRRKKGAEAARLPVTFTSSPAGFPGPAKIAGPNGTVKLYQAAQNGVPITDFDVKVASPLMLYGEGAAAGATTLSLTLEGPNTTGVAEGEVVSEKINVVKPKIEAEYKLVLLEKNLSHHLAKGETKIYADATYIQVSIEESDASKHPYKKNAKLTCSPANAELFLDEKCTKAFDGTLTNKQLTNSAELYLRGKIAGKFTLKLELAPGDGFIRVEENPAELQMATVDLELKVHQFDPSTLAALEENPDTDPVEKYYENLENLNLPDQKVMTDAEKIGTGRMLHAQAGNHFGRARLLFAKLDASKLPDGVDDYEIILTETAKHGGVAMFDKEHEGTKIDLPVKVKIKDLKAKEYESWCEGSTATEDFRQVRLDLGMDRDAGGLEKTPKRNGDWARFTVAEIKKVEVQYKPPKGEAAAWDTANHRFYINFGSDPDGRKVEIGATLSKKLKDVVVHFMLAPHADNRKSANWGVDIPATWKWKDVSADVKHKDRPSRTKLLHVSAKTDANGFAKAELTLSRFGGDQFQPACYLEQDPHLAKYIPARDKLQKRKPVLAEYWITVWRKFWYEVLKVQGIACPGMGSSEQKYERVKTTMKNCPDVPIKRSKVNGFNPKAIYPKYMVILNGGNDDALVVADTNKDQFFDVCKDEKDKPIKVPILVCDAQWDEGGNSGALNPPAVDPTAFPLDLTTDKLVLIPPLQGGNLLASGTWIAAEWDAAANAGAGGWANVRNGNLAAGDLAVNPARGDLQDVRVGLPAGVGATTADTKVWIKDLVIKGANGPYLGEYSSATKKILAVYDPDEPVDFQNTIGHELGHAFSQVTKVRPAGVPAHPHQYNKQGSHCSEQVNKCLMYESGPIAGSLDCYCDVCHPYVLVQDMSDLA